MLDRPWRGPFIDIDMMRFRVVPAWALAFAGVFAVALSPDAALAQRRPVRISSVELSPADAAIQVGQQQIFLPTAYDASNNPVATATFTFQSSNVRIATVDANGIATGVAPGTAIITVRTGTGATAKSATATLTVNAAGPVVQQEAARPQPVTPTPTPTTPVAARPAGVGFAAFECQPEGTGAAVGLTLSPLRITLVRGENKQLGCRAVRGDGETAARVPIVFAVMAGGERVARVDSVGLISAVGDTGRATVRAEVPGNAAIQPRQVTVDVRGDSVRFADSEVWLSPGTIDTLVVEVPAQDRVLAVGSQFQFSSTDDAKVRVAPLQPIVTAVGPGTARISGESPYYTISTTVNVHRRVTRIAVTPADSALTLAMTQTRRLDIRALGGDGDSTPVPEAPLRWTLPDTAVARFDTATRTLRGIRMGTTTLAVRAPYGRDSVITRAWQIRVVAGGLAVSRTRVGIGVGERLPLSVEQLDDRRQPMGPATGLTWRSTDTTIAKFAEGHIVGVGVGHAQLTGRAPWDSTVTVSVYVGGQLLASAQRGGRWDLYAMTADSVPVFAPLTADSAVELEPAWSPDLTRIAFTSAVAANMDLFVANADGTERRRLTNDSATVSSPVFVRPNGERIVFQSNRGGREQIYIITADGSGRRQLTAGENANKAPDISPDGRKMLFVSLRQMPGSARNYDIWEMNLDSAGERRVTASPQSEDAPQYAADGRSFYFLRNEGGTPPTNRLYRQSLTDSTAAALPITPVGMFVRNFSVSSDGNLIVLTKLESQRGIGEVPRLVLFNPATGASTNVQIPAGEQVAGPVFRPATPQPR